jgi:hypothetical protein
MYIHNWCWARSVVRQVRLYSSWWRALLSAGHATSIPRFQETENALRTLQNYLYWTLSSATSTYSTIFLQRFILILYYSLYSLVQCWTTGGSLRGMWTQLKCYNFSFLYSLHPVLWYDYLMIWQSTQQTQLVQIHTNQILLFILASFNTCYMFRSMYWTIFRHSHYMRLVLLKNCSFLIHSELLLLWPF